NDDREPPLPYLESGGRLTPQPPGNARSPRQYWAARTAFRSSMPIVIGPPPPGPGVISPATSATPGSTSPTTPSSPRFIPTSITVAPSRTSPGPTTPAFLPATTSTSACRGPDDSRF